METAYLAKIDLESTDRICLTIPDLPGFVFEADHDNMVRALSEAEALLTDYLAVMRKNGRDIPESRSISHLQADREIESGSAWYMLRAVLPTGKVTRTMISMDETELEMIDRKAKERGMTRSGFIVSAARAA